MSPNGWGLCVSPARNAEAVENNPRRVGTIQCVEMNAGNVVIQKIVTLFQSEMNANAADPFTIVLAPLQGTHKLGRKACASGELGDAPNPAHGGNRHNASDNRNADVGQHATLAEIKEVAVIEK